MTILSLKIAITKMFICLFIFLVGLFPNVPDTNEPSKPENVTVTAGRLNLDTLKSQPPKLSKVDINSEQIVPEPSIVTTKSIETAELIEEVKPVVTDEPVKPSTPTKPSVRANPISKEAPKEQSHLKTVKEEKPEKEVAVTSPVKVELKPEVPVTFLVPLPDTGIVAVSLPPMKKGYMAYVVIEKGKENYNFKMERAQNVPLPFGSGSYTIILYQGSGDDFIEVERTTVDATFSSATMALQQTVLSPGLEDMHVKQIMDTEFKGWRNWSAEQRIEMVHFYITNTFQYDYEVAENPVPWYLPSAKRLVATNQGICYDMASLTSSLLREMQVPTHVVMGYAKNIDVYHAWNEVYIDKSWKIVDTTFDLGKMSESPYKEPSDYTQVHYRF